MVMEDVLQLSVSVSRAGSLPIRTAMWTHVSITAVAKVTASEVSVCAWPVRQVPTALYPCVKASATSHTASAWLGVSVCVRRAGMVLDVSERFAQKTALQLPSQLRGGCAFHSWGASATRATRGWTAARKPHAQTNVLDMAIAIMDDATATKGGLTTTVGMTHAQTTARDMVCVWRATAAASQTGVGRPVTKMLARTTAVVMAHVRAASAAAAMGSSVSTARITRVYTNAGIEAGASMACATAIPHTRAVTAVRTHVISCACNMVCV